jgi:hypothetical protein
MAHCEIWHDFSVLGHVLTGTTTHRTDDKVAEQSQDSRAALLFQMLKKQFGMLGS